jgi:hypothetical protein
MRHPCPWLPEAALRRVRRREAGGLFVQATRHLLLMRCAECGHEKVAAYSCKRRGIWPSCGGRRMAETAAWLVDRVIPQVPVRQ